MTSDNPVADRLVTDARKKTERSQSSTLAMAALIIGIVGALAAGFIPLAGWILGAVAIVVGVAAILVGVFFSLTIA